ncbi:NAD-dependent epimerase/dehydratase family protein [Sphingomonas sp. TF3]|uniref:NAD-dependent epimerase/dehydratase family protein n=1 Tax=Sphingomonas sp. TF3 TaxID=2495580 RepID=UPI000F85F4FB|nr:NAD-dependent epimerase/dehydratase family protein [Sphingomonas sp. TF3]RUN78371.1 NAD-dependent epimerase/dehydratase family protein [Sphingomonas sp. TF3]
MKVLVIGATGYIGSHIAQRLVRAGHAVSGTARSAGAAERVAGLGALPVIGDLTELDTLDRAIADADAVVYAAQLLLEPEHDTLAALVERLAGGGKTLIFTSGSGVLSQKTDGDWSEDSFAEADDFVPSKWLVRRVETETLVRSAGDRGVRAMVVRPPMIWGHGGCGLIEAFYASAARTGEVCYLGRGLNLYSNVHVDDLAEVYALAIERGTPAALYHCVAGEVAHRTLAERVAAQLGCATRSIGFDEAAKIWGKFLALIIMSTCSRTSSPRARAELGWTPRHLDMLSDVAHAAYRGE